MDMNYVRLFRVLDGIRQKLQHSITDQLRSLQVSKDWMLSGRLCSPRVLFLFEACLFRTNEIVTAGKRQVFIVHRQILRNVQILVRAILCIQQCLDL